MVSLNYLRMIYRLKVLLLLAVVGVSVSAQEKDMVDGVVWVVGDAAVLRSDVEQERIRAQYQGERLPGDPYCFIPEQIAIQKLFIHQAKIDSIVVNDGQVEAQVNAQLSMMVRQIGSQEQLELYYRKPYAEIKDELRTFVADQSLVQQVQQRLVDKIKVTPADVRKYYNSTPEDSLPTVPAQVEVQIITLEPPVPESVREETKERLRQMAERVNRGDADFAVLASLYSEDTESAKQGGELGFLGRGALVPEFADAAFSLTEPGKLSRVVETEFGYHLIQLIERRDDRVNCRHILLRPRITSDLKMRTLSSLDSIAADIRMGEMTFEATASLLSSDKDSRMNGGQITNPNTGAAKFEYQDLPAEIAKKVYDMKVGDVSEAFSMFSEQLGRDVYAIVRLKAKNENHKANLTDDFQLLKGICENSMRQAEIERWIRQKISDTYIYISPEWRDCKFQYSEWLQK